MAASTGIILTAGALPIAEMVMSEGWQADRGIRLVAGTALAALAAAGLDKVIPGFGTGTAAVLLVASLYKYGPRLAQATKELTGTG